MIRGERNDSPGDATTCVRLSDPTTTRSKCWQSRIDTTGAYSSTYSTPPLCATRRDPDYDDWPTRPSGTWPVTRRGAVVTLTCHSPGNTTASRVRHEPGAAQGGRFAWGSRPVRAQRHDDAQWPNGPMQDAWFLLAAERSDVLVYYCVTAVIIRRKTVTIVSGRHRNEQPQDRSDPTTRMN